MQRVGASCAEGIRGKVSALILGGGYGRGEGGVRVINGEYALFNDLDYFLFSPEPGNAELVAWVRDWERTESEDLGIDVECVILPDEKLRRPERTMMFSDLCEGHIVVMGEKGVLDHWAELVPAGRIPLAEATRLLWNRGSGLFFSIVEAGKGEADSVFIQRNLAKVKLAMGDALLCLHHRYCGSSVERAKRLRALEEELLTDQIRGWHAEAVEFKFQPKILKLERAELNELLRETLPVWEEIFLAVETSRLRPRRPFGGLAGYARTRRRLFPESPLARNLLLAFRDRCRRGGGLKPVWDYPRGGLYRALAVLLESWMREKDLVEVSRWMKGVPEKSAYRDLAKPYMKWWHHYS